MKELELYLVEFEGNGIIKHKSYPEDCQIGREHCRLAICITHDEGTFLVNNSKRLIW